MSPELPIADQPDPLDTAPVAFLRVAAELREELEWILRSAALGERADPNLGVEMLRGIHAKLMAARLRNEKLIKAELRRRGCAI